MKEKNELQKIVDRAILKLRKLAEKSRIAIIETYSWNTKKNEPYKFSREDWQLATEAITAEAIYSAVESGVVGSHVVASFDKVSKHFLNLDTSGVKLSDRLRDSAREAEKLVAKTMSDHLKNKTTFLRLTEGLTAQKASRGDLPKYLTELADAARLAGGDTLKINRLISKAEKQIAGLKTGGYSQVNLDRAYKQVIEAVKSGDKATLDSALKTAIDQKAVSNNANIAITETANANSQATLRKGVDHPLYSKGRVCVKVTLSSGHSIVDICDFITSSNQFGLGAGVFPIDQAEMPPFHGRCVCNHSIIIVDEDVRSANIDNVASEEYFSKMSTEKADKIRKSQEALKKWNSEKERILPADLVKKA